MISLRYRRRNNATVIKVFINKEPVEAVDITSLISEEAFHIRYSVNGQNKGWLHITGLISGNYKLYFSTWYIEAMLSISELEKSTKTDSNWTKIVL